MLVIQLMQTFETELMSAGDVNSAPLCYYKSPKGIYAGYLNLFVKTLGWQQLWLCFVMVYIKSNEDILEGISKLDHLLKCSEFQNYKIGVELEGFHQSLMSSLMKESDRLSTQNSEYYMTKI